MAVHSSQEMRNRRYLFEEVSVPRALYVMALPAIASQLITLIYNMADTWFVGRTNDPYKVAGCSLVLPIFMLTVVISNVFGSGGGTMIARLIGSGEDEEAGGMACLILEVMGRKLRLYLNEPDEKEICSLTFKKGKVNGIFVIGSYLSDIYQSGTS